MIREKTIYTGKTGHTAVDADATLAESKDRAYTGRGPFEERRQ